VGARIPGLSDTLGMEPLSKHRVVMVFDMGCLNLMGGRLERTVRRTTARPYDLLRRVEKSGMRFRTGKHEILYIAPHRLISARIEEAVS
jgi:hypothetical protein